MTVPLFELAAVEVTTDGQRRLAGIDLCLPKGGITVLAGPSGSGKSTLLRLCNRLEVPTAGEVSFRGRSLQDWDPLVLRRTVGMVFQSVTLFPGTVRDNLVVARPDGDEAAMIAALGQGDLDPAFLDRSGDELSGGEAQRVCLARTLLTEPEVLLLDEPTSSLDPEATARLESSVTTLVANEETSAVWVTHDDRQEDRLADRVVRLDAGRVVR